MRKDAERLGALRLSNDSHDFILDEIERRLRLECDPRKECLLKTKTPLEVKRRMKMRLKTFESVSKNLCACEKRSMRDQMRDGKQNSFF